MYSSTGSFENKKYRFVSVKGKKVLGKGGHGIVYQLTDDSIIKVYTDSSPLENIERERVFSRLAFLKEVPCAITFDTVITEEGFANIFETVGYETLGSYVEGHPEELEELGEKFADFLIGMHKTRADNAGLTGIKDIYRDRIERASVFFKPDETKYFLEILDVLPEGNTIVHGDYHPQNVMINDKKELYLIDMADISCGNGIFDIGSAYTVLGYAAENSPGRAKSISGMSPDKCLRFWDILIRKYYNITDDESCKNYNEICKYFNYFRMMSTLGQNNSRSRMLNMLIRHTVRKKLIKNKDRALSVLSGMNMQTETRRFSYE